MPKPGPAVTTAKRTGEKQKKEHVMTGKLDSKEKTIVLVHGGFVDGSGWEEVYKTLKKDGYDVTIVQNPTISLEEDVAVTKRVLETQDGPVILVGHSYGGAVITEAVNLTAYTVYPGVAQIPADSWLAEPIPTES
jgi:pimeloyl-ACP methyl ester carboxylesterase